LPAGWLSVRDAADNLGVSRQRVHVLIKAGGLEARRWRGWWLVVSRSSLDTYAIERGRPCTPAQLARRRAIAARKRSGL
jgi:excisionase family DNA binding protein